MQKRKRKALTKPKTIFHLISLFPEALSSYIKESIIGRALADNYIDIKTYNLRDFTKDKHKRVDRIPYGGGPGMVIEALPVIKAIESAKRKAKSVKREACIIWLSPSGKQFDSKEAEKLSKEKNIIFICGRYEGIDERVREIFKTESYSVGPYTLTGGELPALIMMDAISRQIPGVLGNESSVEEKRISSPEVYTRPEVLIYKKKTYKVPDVLLSGNHKEIREWKERKRKN
ncbi:MAG: tRNA (guanosine(37)-N1)-methyltransferase TrmD [Candidatus Zambryskibacteria bacterium CG10_big_fil_rev_8_21_14_0_10_42_12]|uniref:tRNA (guanine-N(1)-)-methyltransferase n=1 Tax=Candidatus Zambryskibacteria bacterium CG10_big_fil_rev_8_21_14_0_10_42_12 TaxID=1975115 RepID=A0A2H0QWG1_9BACT|nr:MAG: tRNA (guanosine(37)-N1)-methyltransferase TrmD [Candidatus Zambryskibacteria bacterium CG10_big_fil_rev_8_21_14_0_10_42_12]